MEPTIKNEISDRLLGPEPDIEQRQHTMPTITINDHDPFQTAHAAAADFSMDPTQSIPVLPLRAEAQQPEYRDAPFAIAFVLQIVVIMFLAFGWGISALTHSGEDPTATSDQKDGNSDDTSVSLAGLLWLCFFTSLTGIAISAVSLQIMTHHAETLIQSSLIVSCCFMGLLVVAFFSVGLVWVAILWLVVLVMTAWYAYLVWSRIPAAAANLRTALSAIENNAGVCVVAYGIASVANLWVVVWCLAFVGVSFKESSCTDGVCQSHMNALSIILLILSYYWTSQVIKNVLHVTVSGVVGTWWFAPQDCLSVWSPVIMDSFSRATTYSFGSICMGSLLVALIQTLETIVRSARQRRNGGNELLLCILECILRLLSRVAKYFNRWAYVYVGLYGYDYLTAGKKVLELFEARGWTMIINDNLIHRCLVLVAVVIGALTGFVGILLGKATGWATAALGENSDVAVFFICFFVGVSMAIILMGVVLSAVDTIIVSFAEAPAEFETNHPALYQNMVEKWRVAYPDEF